MKIKADLTRLISLILISSLILASSCKKKEIEPVSNTENIAVEVGATAPNFTLKDPNNKDISLIDFRGDIILVEFWASWCGICQDKSDDILALYNQYHPMGFDILGVSIDENKTEWLSAIEEDGLIYNNVITTNGVQSEVPTTYGIQGVPTMILIDENGIILLITHSEEELKEQLKRYY
ncbi:MAG: TlpA family protein disulfide reductase [Bacteroidales bacterium]|nr:TlpA family protein disulfide reductase [Bacteroidales bacterium]